MDEMFGGTSSINESKTGGDESLHGANLNYTARHDCWAIAL
jgi:hypothetical protein